MSERRFSLPSLRPFAAILSLSLALSSYAAVYAPGLLQAKFTTGQEDRTNDIASATSTAYAAGTIMANTTGSAKDWDETSWAWAGNTSFGYLGEMWMEAGTTYTFGKQLDDWVYVKINGEVLLDNNSWNTFSTCDYTPTATGWVPVEFRFGNGGGGAGVSQSAKYGFAYNTEGNKSWDVFKPANAPWKPVLDPGDGSLLRAVYSQTDDYMTIEDVAVDGADLVVTASFAGLAGPGTLTAFYGPGDGGTASNGWDHCATVAAVAAGDTAADQYRIAGAGSAAFIALRLSTTVGTSTPIQQWTTTFSLAPDAPAFKLVGAGVGYTNLSFTATCLDLGQGASSVGAAVQLALDASFASVVQTGLLALAGLGSESVTLYGLETNTTYYARVVGTNDLQKNGGSSTVSGTTLAPGEPACTVESVVSGLTTFSVTGKATAFGAGAASATMRLEASTSADFATLAGFAETNATLGGSSTLEISGLEPDTEYRLRLRIVNDWGLETSTNLLPASTLDAPIVASGFRRTFAPDISTVDVFFDITTVFDGATGTATLYCDENAEPTTNRGERAVSAPGTLTWAAIPFGGNAYNAKVVLVSVANGVTYTQTWSAVVDHSFKRFRPVKFDTANHSDCVTVDEPGTARILHPEYAFDGNYSTGASAEVGCSVIGNLAKMLYVPQDQEVYATRIDVTLAGNSRYSLYTSEDGTTWNLVGGAKNVSHSGTASYSVFAVANYVKCTFESSSNNGAPSLLEVEAWGFVKAKLAKVSNVARSITFRDGAGHRGNYGFNGGSYSSGMFDGNFTSGLYQNTAGCEVVVPTTTNTVSETGKPLYVTEVKVGHVGNTQYSLYYTTEPEPKNILDNAKDPRSWTLISGANHIQEAGTKTYLVNQTVTAVKYVFDTALDWTQSACEFEVWAIDPDDLPCMHETYDPETAEWTLCKPPTCTENAVEESFCPICGARFEREVLGTKLGHIYVATLTSIGRPNRYGSGFVSCSRTLEDPDTHETTWSCDFRIDFDGRDVDFTTLGGIPINGVVQYTDLTDSSTGGLDGGISPEDVKDNIWTDNWNGYWFAVGLSTNEYVQYQFGTTIELTKIEFSVLNQSQTVYFSKYDPETGEETLLRSIPIAKDEAEGALGYQRQTVDFFVYDKNKKTFLDAIRMRIGDYVDPVTGETTKYIGTQYGSRFHTCIIEFHPWGTIQYAGLMTQPPTTIMILR